MATVTIDVLTLMAAIIVNAEKATNWMQMAEHAMVRNEIL